MGTKWEKSVKIFKYNYTIPHLMISRGAAQLNHATICVKCNSELEAKNEPFPTCPSECNSIVKNVYKSELAEFKERAGIWRYGWLPVRRTTAYGGGSVTYHSQGLGKELGLKELYVSFTGYWPEIKAQVKTGTFKELEAVVAIQYAKERGVSQIISASAGSSARAFAYIASLEKFGVILVVPDKVTDELTVPSVDENFVKLIAVKGEYCDAISFAEKLHISTGIASDGGGRNPARRDALGTILLEAVEEIGFIPGHYFQAISSGAGAIAAFETAERLVCDGRFGKTYPKIHISQNEPFTPMVKAWKAERREIVGSDIEPENVLDSIYAKVLSNRRPLYGLEGGVFDALRATNGEAYGVTNGQAKDANRLFEELEGIDLHPAAAVATASLITSKDEGKIGKNDVIMLNISGGGLARAKRELGSKRIPIAARVEKDAQPEDLRDVLQ
jgi:cysteate synthase